MYVFHFADGKKLPILVKIYELTALFSVKCKTGENSPPISLYNFWQMHQLKLIFALNTTLSY